VTITRGQHLIGKRLGSCTLEKLLGHGGSSAVFLAQEDDPVRKVAVKVFMPRVGLNSPMLRDFYRRFLREAEAASKLDHPNILPVYSYGEEDGIPYIVMPYMPGGTLAEHMSRSGMPSWLEVQWYLEQLASALDYAHKHGCVHCDVKPANILLDSEGHVLLSDFGIARLTRTDEGTEIAEPHGPGVVMGTPDYISPEQALGRSLDGRSDVYSLAVTVFFLLTRRLPFNADSPIALALLHVHELPPALTAVRADITPLLDHVVRKALAKDPANRFQSASAFSMAFATAVLASTAQSSRFAYEQLAKEFDHEQHLLYSEQLPTFVIDKPIVHVKPVNSANYGYRHLLVLMLATCLIIAGAVGSTFNAFTSGLIQLSGPSTALTADVAPGDLLAHDDRWPTSKTFFFQGLSYHIVNTAASQGALALYYHHPFANFRLTVTLQEMQKSPVSADYCGIIFRATSDQSHYYLFEVAPSQGKHYAFLRYDQQWTMITNGTASSLAAGARKKNTVSIEVHDNLFSLKVNGIAIAQPISDPATSPLSAGLIGLYVEDQGAEVAFSRLYVDPEK
jgi:serine/threonine protein kinase